MENIHGVDVSWLHNTNSRGMCGSITCFCPYGGVGGVLFSEARMEGLRLKTQLESSS